MLPPVYTEYFPFLSRNGIRYVILGATNALILSLFDNAFVYWDRSLVGDTVTLEKVIYCWSIFLLLLLNRSPCTNGVCIVGWWCSTPRTEAKETLYYVTIWFIVLLFTRCHIPRSESLSFQPPSFIPTDHPHPPPTPTPLSPLPPPGQVLPVTTTASPPVPPASSLPDRTVI